MYYNGNPASFLKYNTAIIGKKEVGKTTILKQIVKYCVENGYKVLLFDSATNHGENSLLVDTNLQYKNNLVISSPNKKQIHFDTISYNHFPYNDISNNTDCNIYSFDVSKYLKKSYYEEDFKRKNAINMYYKRLVIQELTVMLPIVCKQRCVVLMDEIEFTTDMYEIMEKYISYGIKFIVSMQNLEDLSTSSSLFDLTLIL